MTLFLMGVAMAYFIRNLISLGGAVRDYRDSKAFQTWHKEYQATKVAR